MLPCEIQTEQHNKSKSNMDESTKPDNAHASICFRTTTKKQRAPPATTCPEQRQHPKSQHNNIQNCDTSKTRDVAHVKTNVHTRESQIHWNSPKQQATSTTYLHTDAHGTNQKPMNDIFRKSNEHMPAPRINMQPENGQKTKITPCEYTRTLMHARTHARTHAHTHTHTHTRFGHLCTSIVYSEHDEMQTQLSRHAGYRETSLTHYAGSAHSKWTTARAAIRFGHIVLCLPLSMRTCVCIFVQMCFNAVNMRCVFRFQPCWAQCFKFVVFSGSVDVLSCLGIGCEL